MRFEEWQYLWPPRPENAVARGLLGYYENQGWLAQVKMNGTCSVLAVAPDRKTIKAMSRHKDEHKLWAPGPQTAKPFQSLPGDGWYVFVAELMHSKVPGIRDINYINDILVADGEYLVGTTFAQRQEMLEKLFKVHTLKKTVSHYVIDAHTWLARNYEDDFSELFASLKDAEHEGLVLKDPFAKLAMCTRQGSNTAWQVKCRMPEKVGGAARRTGWK